MYIYKENIFGKNNLVNAHLFMLLYC